MKIAFDCRIIENTLHCTLSVDQDVPNALWSFSLMSVGKVISGAKVHRQLANYLELSLPPLMADVPHKVVLAYAGDHPYKMNRAWTPLGNLLHVDGDVVAFDPIVQGVISVPITKDKPTKQLRIVPPVLEWMPAHDQMARHVSFRSNDSIASAIELSHRMGLTIFTNDPAATALNCILDPTIAPEEYRLNISPNDIKLVASTDTGLHYAAITLISLFLTYDGSLPNGEIRDKPRFAWRGQHLDCARHGFDKSTILKLLDLMALLKMNRFHWHFADDEAFRIPLPSLPELKQLTSRGIGHLIPAVFAAGREEQKAYSLSDVAEIIEHAKRLHIEILPEIEIPAHSYGLCKAFPQTRDPDDTGSEVSIQGYPRNIMNPAMPETWRVIESMIQDIAQIFPFGHIHLGADELPEKAWAGSPKVTRLMQKHGLNDSHDVMGWMMQRVGEIAVKHGMRPAAWEEAQYGKTGGIKNDAILFSWTGQAPGIAAAKAGYDIVMCPAQYTYFDMAHTLDVDDWGASWAACFGLEAAQNWDPIPDPNIADRVVGVQGTYWGEFTTDDAQFEPMIAPRILGLATVAWSAPDQRATCDVTALAQAYTPVFDALNWTPHKNP